jgi:hypothetical protein
MGDDDASFGIGELGNFEEDHGREKTISFAVKLATQMEEDFLLGSENSLQPDDIFRDETMMDSSGEDVGDQDSFGTAIDEEEEDEEEDEDKQIRRELLYAVGGVGFLALMGFAAKNLLKLFGKRFSDDQDIDGGMDISNAADGMSNANDVVTAVPGDGGSSPTSAASATHATNASTSAPTGGLGMNPGGAGGQAVGAQMSAVQTQVVQNMAVSAASNAASSAASLSSAMASAVVVGSAAGAAATIATVTTVASVVRIELESCWWKKRHFTLFHNLTAFSNCLYCRRLLRELWELLCTVLEEAFPLAAMRPHPHQWKFVM